MKKSCASSVAQVLLFALVLVLLPAISASADQRLFTLSDPRGDDHGAGSLSYPLEGPYRDGDLDLLELAVVREKDGTRFDATFANPIEVPGRGAIDELGTPLASVARHGFYTFNIDVYVDMDREVGSGAISLLPGRQAEADPAFAWERAIVLTPRPHAARAQLKDLMMDSLREELKSDDPQLDDERYREMKGMVPDQVESNIFFANRVRVRARTVSFFVPDSFLGGPAETDWAYLVVVTGADLASSLDVGSAYGLSEEVGQRLMVLPVGAGKRTDRFGGGRDDDPLQPPIIDMLVPDGQHQETLLNDYDPIRGRPVSLPGVVPADG